MAERKLHLNLLLQKLRHDPAARWLLCGMVSSLAVLLACTVGVYFAVTLQITRALYWVAVVVVLAVVTQYVRKRANDALKAEGSEDRI